MMPDDFSGDLDFFIDWPVNDESAWLIGNILYLIALRWEDHHFAQILRYINEHRPPPDDPDHPWL
jgi:hypothetical protein